MSMNRFARVAGRLLNVPIMLRQEKAEMLVAALANRLGIGALAFDDSPRLLAQSDLKEMALVGTSGEQTARKIYDVCEGVAIIPVEGTLVHKLGGVDPWSGMVGYDQLALKLRTAMDDNEVEAIWFDGDTPGGEVSGCFDFADELASCTQRMGGKPIWWFANEASYSAGYALASQCDRVILPRTGGVGSIGVVMMHCDLSAALAKDGVKVTLIHSGEHKVDGNPYSPLAADVLSDLQAECDETRLLFADTVARGRRMTIQAVLDTEARCFTGGHAVQSGLADAVASEIDTFATLLATL